MALMSEPLLAKREEPPVEATVAKPQKVLKYPSHHGEAIPAFSPSEAIKKALVSIGVSLTGRDLVATLPFSLNDTTAGSETELQVAVAGRKQDVDLPAIIEESNYFANFLKRAAAGEAPSQLITDLERFLNSNGGNIWENSWVRFPRRRLSPYAWQVFEHDLLAD